MKLRVKLKYLVYTGFLLFAIMPIYAKWVVPAWELKQVEQGFYEGDWESRERILEILESTSSSEKRLSLISRYIIGLHAERDIPYYPVRVTPMSRGLTGNDFQFPIEESYPYLVEYIEEAHYDHYTYAAAKILCFYYAANHQFEQIKQLYTLLEKKAEQNQAQTLFLKGLEDFLWLEVEELFYQGRYSQGYQRLAKGIEEYRERIEKHNQQLEQDGGQRYREYLQKEPLFLLTMQTKVELALAEGEENFPILRGRAVRSDGTPVANIGVILREESGDGDYLDLNWSSSRVSTPYFSQTAEDGSFLLYGLVPGKYRFSFGAPLEQVDGWVSPIEQDDWITVEYGQEVEANLIFRPLIELQHPVNHQVERGESVRFSWEPVQGAVSYSLSLGLEIDRGGSVSQPWRMNITDHYVEIPVEELYELSFYTSVSVEDERYSGASMLGYANPEGRFIWSVSAYDQQGKMISQSDGYRLQEDTLGNLPFFRLQTRELSAADQLLLEQHYDQALYLYEQAYAANPDDLHSLRMIVRLLNIAQRPWHEISIESDTEKLERYLVALAQKQPSRRTLDMLVQFYYEQEQWPKYTAWFQKYREIEERENQQLNAYWQAVNICALIKQGKLAEAQAEVQLVESYDELNRVIEYELNREQQELLRNLLSNNYENERNSLTGCRNRSSKRGVSRWNLMIPIGRDVIIF